MTNSKPQVGDRVIIKAPLVWERRGVVEDVDYHPLGIDDAVQVRCDDPPSLKWWSVRWVFVEVPQQ